MKRELLERLIEWKNSVERKPLILEGARQVGKTYLLKEIFGKSEYENVAYVNFQNPEPELVALFEEGAIKPKRLLGQLELFLGMDIVPGKTLIVFDEIQDVPRALTSLKYFYEEAPEYHIVAAGSLLGVALHSAASYPAGKVNTLRLEPLSFREFLEVSGEGRIVEHLLKEPEDDLFNSKLKDLLREYLYVGGMPEVVMDWVKNHDVQRVEWIQRQLLADYTRDFSKYTDNRMALRIRQVFETLPAQFAKNNDKFLYGVVKSGARAREYELAIEWLVDAGIVRRVFRVKCGDKTPLSVYADKSAFKLYFLDIGLFRCLANIPSEVIFQKNAIFDEFNGLMAEQYVLQQLSPMMELFYWTTDSTAEVDFVGQYRDAIIPIEVKSGENVKAKSLRLYREKYQPKLAIRMSLRKLTYGEGLLNVPLYESFVVARMVKEILGKSEIGWLG